MCKSLDEGSRRRRFAGFCSVSELTRPYSNSNHLEGTRERPCLSSSVYHLNMLFTGISDCNREHVVQQLCWSPNHAGLK